MKQEEIVSITRTGFDEYKQTITLEILMNAQEFFSHVQKGTADVAQQKKVWMTLKNSVDKGIGLIEKCKADMVKVRAANLKKQKLEEAWHKKTSKEMAEKYKKTEQQVLDMSFVFMRQGLSHEEIVRILHKELSKKEEK